MEVRHIRVIHNFPKTDEKTHWDLTQNGWIQLKEPKTLIMAILASIPIMVINTLISLGVIQLFSNLTLREFGIIVEPDMITLRFNGFPKEVSHPQGI